MTDELTPYEPGTPEVVRFVDDRCERIEKAAPGRGAQAAYIHAMKALPSLPFRDDYEAEMSALALSYAAAYMQVSRNITRRWGKHVNQAVLDRVYE